MNPKNPKTLKHVKKISSLKMPDQQFLKTLNFSNSNF